MLPVDLVTLTSGGGRARPRYLSPRDEVWVRAVADRADAFVGRTVGERDAELPRAALELARAHGARAVAGLGIAHVLARRQPSEIASPVPPRQVRAVVFEEANRDRDMLDRENALGRAAARLGITSEAVDGALFADRASARRVLPPPCPLAPAEIVEDYNLSLVQGILLRSELVIVDVREHVRAVVRFAKLARLLCVSSQTEAGTRLEISGPLSILRHTTKYGFALASFFPSVVATPNFRIDARCVLRGEPVAVEITAADRLARTHALPRDADSAVERALARDLRRLGSAFAVVREARALEVAGRLVFPDFALRRGSEEVLVEVVGFYTPEYLASTLEALRTLAARWPLVVCVDETLPCGEGEIPGELVAFRRRIDATALIGAAERALARAAGRRAPAPGAGDAP